MPFSGAVRGRRWIGDIVDDDGYLLQSDGVTRSRVVTEFMAFREQGSKRLNDWIMGKHLWFDILPFGYVRRLQKMSYYENAKGNTTSMTSSPPPRRTVTDTGIDLSAPPELYSETTANLKGDSSTATVMSMATGYGMEVYQRFIGSLRKSGYKGHIILAVDVNDLTPEVLDYFHYRNVTYKTVEMLNHTECVKTSDNYPPIIRYQPCLKKYPHLKVWPEPRLGNFYFHHIRTNILIFLFLF